MKLVFRSQCAIAALMLVFGACSYVQAQTASATPDTFSAQLTSSPGGFSTFAGDITANGRFVVIESNGNLDTQNPRNADGNREIFLIDYAQRRIFQITNTKNVQKPTPTPSPTPTPTPTPTPSPTPTPNPTPTPFPTPADLTQVKIEISSNRPMISFEPALVAGRRTYTIVFSSNAPDPGNFDGTDSPALAADGNMEIWVYQLPEVDDTFDLSSGDELPLVPLTTGTFRQVTNTPPSRPLRIGDTVSPPDIVDDNRDAFISDDGSTIAFISTRDLVPPGNGESCPVQGGGPPLIGNPELFLCRTTGGFAAGSNTFVQGTNTRDTVCGVSNTLQQNPSLSANGSVVAFLSRANLAGGNDDLNPEVFVADFSGSALSNIRQITRTKSEGFGSPNFGLTVNLLASGRRLSRDGKFVAYESRAEDPAANSATNTTVLSSFVSDVPLNTSTNSVAKAVGPRAAADSSGDVIHFPTFTDYNGSLSPGAVVFASSLNFKTDGTTVGDQDTAGLNPAPTGFARQNQIFATQVPVTTSNTYTRLTKNPVLSFVVGLRPLVSNTRQRMAFSLAGIELGGGNADSSSEIFYQLTLPVMTESSAVLSFFTGATDRGPFASANPNSSPTPTPTPTPSPGDPQGLAPGELSTVRSTVGLASSDKAGVGGPETTRSPILPIELNGVSVSVNGAAAGLYFVGDSPAEGISFVMPIGLGPGVATVVINDQRNNNGTVFRGFVQIVGSQPDIFNPPTNGPGGVARACNVTATGMSGSGCIMGPFKVTSADASGTQVPTKLELWTTGNRLALIGETKVSFITGTTTTDVVPSSILPNTNMFGFDLITIELPASLAAAAPVDYKIIVTVTKGTALTSRPEATAPTITIIP